MTSSTVAGNPRASAVLAVPFSTPVIASGAVMLTRVLSCSESDSPFTVTLMLVVSSTLPGFTTPAGNSTVPSTSNFCSVFTSGS
ncbi:hypothetical protein D3C71_1680160 [compost metagenome]